MLRFAYPTGQLHNIHIMVEEREVGRLSYDTYIPAPLFTKLELPEELCLLESIDKPEHSLHLDFICIFGTHSGQGFFRKAMAEFEVFTKECSYSAVTLMSSGSMLKPFESMGYTNLGYISGLDRFALRKDLI